MYCHLNLNSAQYFDVMSHRFNDGSMYFHRPQKVGPPPCSKTRIYIKKINLASYSTVRCFEVVGEVSGYSKVSKNNVFYEILPQIPSHPVV